MNRREQQIRRARKTLSDEQLLAFLKSVRINGNIAVKLILEEIKEGRTFDEIFYTGAEHGYFLSVRKISGGRLKISFSCHPSFDVGDGGNWKVLFDGTDVVRVEMSAFHIV